MNSNTKEGELFLNNIITNEDMANYMTMVFGLEELHNGYCRGPEYANNTFSQVGNYLAKYYISTGDSSIESAKTLVQMYLEHRGNDFIKKYYMPFCESTVAKELNINASGMMDLSSRIRIHDFIAERNANNRFYSHCFPGALYDEVNENGLDIHKEMFKEEYKELEKCFKTAFQTGNLNYCELSAASLGYATMGMPERATFSIGGNIHQNMGESRYDACIRTLKENLLKEVEKGHVAQEEYDKLQEAGTHIIDFYCDNPMGCVAFFRSELTKDTPRDATRRINVEGKYISAIKGLSSAFKDTFIEKVLQDVEDENKQNPGNEITNYQKAINTIVDIMPEFENVIDDIFCNNLGNYEVANLRHGGNADGYAIEGGKLDRNNFAITRFKLPSSIALENQVQVAEHSSSVASDPKAKEKAMTANELRNIERIFNSVIDEMPDPDSIERVRGIVVGIKQESVCVPGRKLIGKTEDGKPIYSLFAGKIDYKLPKKILGERTNDEEEKMVEEYKTSPEFDDSLDEDDIRDEAIDWKAKQIFEGLDDAEKGRIIHEILVEAGTFTVSNHNGKASLTLLTNDGTPPTEYTGETLYSSENACKYGKLFDRMREGRQKSGREDCEQDEKLRISLERGATVSLGSKDNKNVDVER